MNFSLPPIGLAVTLLLFTTIPMDVQAQPDGSAEISLNGKTHSVRWLDGDTLSIESGRRRGMKARLVGYNTLESYGPVHRWGDWSPTELYTIAKAAKQSAAKERWNCSTRGKKDSYDRLLVDCPDLRRELLRTGIAHLFAYNADPDPGDLELQRKARQAQVGIWEKGRPEHIVSNVHADDTGRVFLRIVSTRSGKTEVQHQREDFEPCDEICHGPSVSGSCMLFVPHELRRDEAPACIK
ncbi:MAG: thermonuclease family protein [Myxococcota bacterium]|nr:thermonuclease family protein [Myxococcota bacterium]